MVTKSKPKIQKAKRKLMMPPKREPKARVALGIDTSMSSIAICGRMYDFVLNKDRGPVWTIHRWTNDDHYHKRLKEAAYAHNFILDVLHELKGVVLDISDIHIGIEQPWAPGQARFGASSFLMQQAQIQGAVLSSLLRYGYTQVYEINIPRWQKDVAFDMGMKWSKKEGFNKWTIKEWCQEMYPEIPDWPDLIKNPEGGLMPKPKTSKAKAVQPDDRVDATAIMQFIWDKRYEEYVG